MKNWTGHLEVKSVKRIEPYYALKTRRTTDKSSVQPEDNI